MKGLKLLLDGLFWLAVCLDMVSTLVLLHLGFSEVNPLYAFLGQYWFWIVYVLANFACYGGFQVTRRWFPGRWSLMYATLLLPVAGHMVCAVHNIELIGGFIRILAMGRR